MKTKYFSNQGERSSQPNSPAVGTDESSPLPNRSVHKRFVVGASLWFGPLAAIGLAVTPCCAVPVLFTLEGDPLSQWEVAQRDSTGTTTSTRIVDTNGDGRELFVAQIEPVGGIAFQMGGDIVREAWIVVTDPAASPAQGSMFLKSIDGDPLVVDSILDFVDIFTLGQQVSVASGMITGFNGLVHPDPGIRSAEDLLTTDVRSLPTFNGEAEVVGLLTAQVIPEPATAMLLPFGLLVLVLGRKRQWALAHCRLSR